MRHFPPGILFAVLLLIFAFGVFPPPAYTQRAISPPADASSPTSDTKTHSSDADLRSEVEQLQLLVREQQKRIAALEAGRQASVPATSAGPSTPTDVAKTDSPVTADAITSAAPAAASATATPAPGTAEPANGSPRSSGPQPQTAQNTQNLQQSGSSDERIRNLERQIQGLGPISFSGDVRLRGEPFFGGPTNESLDQMRARIRARFNAIADLGSQFRTGFSLASGDINDPTSTNQTLTGFYTRKTVALDQAFIQYSPKQFSDLSVIGGKFRYPWYNTELTWDKDLNPEGVAETLAFKPDTPVLKRIAFIGFQLPFAAVAGTTPTDQRTAQDITYGGQLQTTWRLASHLSLSAYSAYYNYRGADAIALALARASTKNPQTPLSGVLPLTSGNPVQDSIYTTTASTVITIAGKAYPTGVTSVTNAQFASKFGLFDNIARLDIDTGSARFPLFFLGDYVQNTEACGNLANILAIPANTATQSYKQTVNAPCDSHYRRGYWAEGRLGRLQEKGDIQFGYTHMYIEREAVLGNFNYSDIRQGTNVTEHRADVFYQFDRNVQLGFTALIGRPLGTTEPWLTRLQFDAIYIF